MPRLPKIYRHFFYSCQSSAFRQKYQQRKGPGKSRLFSTLKKEAKAEKAREISLSSFLGISEISILLKKVASIYIEDKSQKCPAFHEKRGHFSQVFIMASES